MQYRIEELRKAAGLSQEKLAQKADISRATLINAERGEDVRASTLVSIAKALDVPTYALFMP